MAEEQPRSLRPFVEVQQEVRRLFHELVHQPWGGHELPSVASWQPCCNMEETDDAFIVEVELPGVTKDNVHLHVEGDTLHIAGERQASAERQGRSYLYLEQHYGRFERQLRLPGSVDREAIQAEFRDGILTVVLPKTAQRSPTSETIRKDA